MEEILSVGGWTCENGSPWNLEERLIAAAAAAAGPVGPVGPGPVVLFGRVIGVPPPSPPSPPAPPSPVRIFGPLPPITSELVDKLEASAYDTEIVAYIAGLKDKKPDELVCKINIIREGGREVGRKRSRDEVVGQLEALENKRLVVKFLDYVAVVPEQECKMPDGNTVPGVSAADLMSLVVGVLGDEASKKLKLGRTGDSEANLLVMPGLYEKGEEQKFNKIHKRQATLPLEYKRRCDMCGEVPRKSGREINACGASVVMPDGRTVELYVCLACPSGRMLVCGETVEVKKSLNSHSAHAKVVRAEAEPVAEPGVGA
jgi:hypothetical protein